MRQLMTEVFEQPPPRTTQLEEAMRQPDRLDGVPRGPSDSSTWPFAARRGIFEGTPAPSAAAIRQAEGLERWRLEDQLSQASTANRSATSRQPRPEGRPGSEEPTPKQPRLGDRDGDHEVLVAATDRWDRGQAQLQAWDTYAALQHVSEEEA